MDRGNPWTRPVGREVIHAAREGKVSILLTPTKPIPEDWLPPLAGARVLCLASGGGQQGPVLAAAGARVTVLDSSPRQLAQDDLVARREGLELQTFRGDMADLSGFPEESFDLVVHPCSNCFVPDVRNVWREAHRVLRPEGSILSGFSNGFIYIFDDEAMDQGILEVRHSLPYSDLDSLSQERLETLIEEQRPLEFGHTLTDQIEGQIAAGFVICGFYEDVTPGEPLAEITPTFIATRAVKVPCETRRRR